MMAAADTRLNSREVQAAVAFIALRAMSQADAEKGLVSAALAIVLATRGPVGAVDYLRDLADVIEHDAVLPPGEAMQ